MAEQRRRRRENITAPADHATLRENYRFLPEDDPETWQERMVQRYHADLIHDCVGADLTRAPEQIGLRWRTRADVASGKGEFLCGNKHCKSRDRELNEYEVPFSYQEDDEDKTELVTLRLCCKCGPLLMGEASDAEDNEEDDERPKKRRKKDKKKQKKKHRRRETSEAPESIP